MGLIGPTFSFLAERMQTKVSAIVWLISTKAVGFLIGTLISNHLYTW